MVEKHLSSQFDADLNLLSTRMLEMGGMVESQIADALEVAGDYDLLLVERVLAAERRINSMEIEIDEEISNIIARRQPTARDLRLLMATSKCITNLERAGDEARKVAKRARRIHDSGAQLPFDLVEVKVLGEMALRILRKALDAFARMDTLAATQIREDDVAIDNEFRAFVRKLISSMMDHPQSISTGLDYLSIAKAIERIGDHAKNIAEFVIYVVRGTDIRHVSRDLGARNASGG